MKGAACSDPVIELRDVTKRYPGRIAVHALQPTNLAIGRGESLAVVGPSGSGKSTLLNILGLLDAPTHGTYLLEGVDITAADEAVRGVVRGQMFGFVFQAFHLLPHRTVVENVELAMMYATVTVKDRRERALEALEALGLMHRRDADPRDLSGGERQRTAIARAICLRPKVLFCDEPTGNLDTRNSAIVMDVLADLNEKGQTLVMVTHNLSLASSLLRTVTVEDGIVADGARPPA
ncbi:macrolide ABC transporter ATP-binding protein [Sinomonas humi]|uniref:Macrolide ABC transporter ATP-binding protein n=1 Tax=Sinomonas humi TaxID=1338436 RepID=A0A0B2AGU4_9MICC|nr:macrolide ABC transporter ATP-binding protein [Sinomonas humi]